jgi:two-component system chemotaxis response regulator CheY
MDSMSLLETIKATGQVRFGFVTSQGTPDMRKQAEEAGALFLIEKPFTAGAFERTLTKHLG